jgi:hypothetical protein
MLNFNYNTLISNLKRETKGFVQFQVRNDPFSSSIVLALPGSTFKNGAYQNQFQMSSEYADISAYVKAGPNAEPTENNLVTYISSSGDGITYPTSSLVKFTTPGTRYSTSLYFNSTASLVVDKLWPEKQGANLTLSSSFTIEAWVAWEQTASATSGTTNSWKPNRTLAYKYDPSIPSSSAYLYYNEWGGNTPTISGSSNFIYDYNNQIGGGESSTTGTSSLAIVPYDWNHYAVSYTKVTPGHQYSGKLRLYKNGLQLVNRDLTGQPDINQDISEYLQIFGGTIESPLYDSAGGQPGYLQDFRLYNGTDKNYTASIIPLPESIVQWPGV